MTDGRSPKVLSCASCRQRKIKCDKVQPVCTQCSRASLECVFPSRKPTRRLPRPRQSELLERISRLESIVGQADPEKLQELDRETGHSASLGQLGPQTKRREDTTVIRTISPEDQSSNSKSARSDSKGTTSRYLSEEFWSNLCQEVEGIKHALDQTSDDDDGEYEQDENSPQSNETAFQSLGEPSGFLMGNPNYRDPDQLTHPPSDVILRLWAIYTRNVDPLIKIIHRPSLDQDIQAFISPASRYHISASQNVLLFSIYFAAISTLAPEEVQAQFGEPHDHLISRYRNNVERALAAADYLDTTSLATVQALTIYVTMLRVTSKGKASWALTSLVVRLAQSMNLHRDGKGARFSPFEAEMRRRVWYFITCLDIRGAEDRGSEAILTLDSYTTVIPTNIDDDAFEPNTLGPLIPKATPGDGIICLCMARCTVFGYIFHPRTHDSDRDGGNGPLHTEDDLIRHVRALENDFIHSADPNHLASRYASDVARMVILKLWLIVQYPFSAQPTIAPMRVSRQTMLRTAVSVIELSDRMVEGVWKDRFAWWTKCYVQWHPLAVALAELCIQTETELAERAWTVVERVFPLWRDTVADSAQGPLWRPIKKLYKRARAARRGTILQHLSINEEVSNTVIPQPLPDPMNNILPTTLPAPGTPLEMGQLNSMALANPLELGDLDLSDLFQYNTSLNIPFDQSMENTMSFDMAPWNDFLNDTQMDYSPGSGGGDSF